jgi:hypothetical protein
MPASKRLCQWPGCHGSVPSVGGRHADAHAQGVGGGQHRCIICHEEQGAEAVEHEPRQRGDSKAVGGRRLKHACGGRAAGGRRQGGEHAASCGSSRAQHNSEVVRGLPCCAPWTAFRQASGCCQKTTAHGCVPTCRPLHPGHRVHKGCVPCRLLLRLPHLLHVFAYGGQLALPLAAHTQCSTARHGTARRGAARRGKAQHGMSALAP